jgi:calcineurin-like phosphoesterase family protein
MSNVFFTADTHFGHGNIMRFSNRPWPTIELHDEALIRNWNEVVRLKDDVWHLGDFNFRSTLKTPDYVNRLNGRIHLVLGNHDDAYAKKFPRLFASVQEAKYLRIGNEKITLYHYAQRVWRNSHHGAWHLFGHSHNCLPPLNRSMDVGVDAQNYTPISFDAVREFMLSRPPTPHHPQED